MKTAFLSLGSNIGEPDKNLRSAVNALNLLPGTEVEAVSNFYETTPVGYSEQRNFINICVKVGTELSSLALLGACLGIEAGAGRERPFKNSPRILDIDLLLYEGEQIDTSELTVPHPRMSERAFVLVPLKDILPSMTFDNFDFNDDYIKCDKNGVSIVL